jgi:ATP-dependent Clp protease ATP-binding subunit ClpC
VAEERAAAPDSLVAAAEREARTLRHDHIGTEHLLLGVLSQADEVGARALGALGVTLGDARAHVMRIVGLPDEPSPPALPLTPPARDALAGALREAIELGRTTPGPEHVLLALLRERDGVAVRVMLGAGVDPRRLREEVRGLAASGAPAGAGPPAAGADARAPRPGAPARPPPPGAPPPDRLVGGYALLGVLAAGGPAAALLREHGVDEDAVAELLRRA